MVTLSFTIFSGQKNYNRAHMLFQVLCGFEPIFYTTHPNEEPIFIAFNVLASSIGSVLGYKWDDILLVNVENVSNVTKLILIIFYIVIFKNTELPNSFFIRFASKNEALLDRRN